MNAFPEPGGGLETGRPTVGAYVRHEVYGVRVVRRHADAIDDAYFIEKYGEGCWTSPPAGGADMDRYFGWDDLTPIDGSAVIDLEAGGLEEERPEPPPVDELDESVIREARKRSIDWVLDYIGDGECIWECVRETLYEHDSDADVYHPRYESAVEKAVDRIREELDREVRNLRGRL